MGLLIQIVIVLLIAGAVVYIIQLLPIEATFKRIAVVVIIVALAIYVLKYLVGTV
jgi:hypothetical protein